MNTQRQQQLRPGFTLLDSVLSIFVVAVMISIFATFAINREANRQTAFRAKAAAMADEEINALKRLGFDNLSNQTNGSFRNVVYNAGTWTLVTDGTTALDLAKISGVSNQVSGRLLYPAGAYANGTLQAQFKILSDSPTGWSTGFLFRAQDPQNGYRVRLGATTTDLDTSTSGTQNLVIEKLVAGTVTVLFSKSNAPISLDTWTTIKLVMDDTASTKFQFFIGGTQQNATALSDSTYTSGPAALIGWNGVHLRIDDPTTIVGSTTTTWDFNGATELPSAWVRLGVNDIVDLTPTTFDDNALLTIDSYPATNSANLKRATVTIRWANNSGLRSYTATVLLGKSTIGL